MCGGSNVHIHKLVLTALDLVEMDGEEEPQSTGTVNSFSSSEETAVSHSHQPHPLTHTHSQSHQISHSHTHVHSTYTTGLSQPYADVDPGSRTPSPSPPISTHVYRPPDRHPSVIFSFPTPTAYAAPPNPTAHIAPFATGSTSELYKCIVKKPEVVQLEINGEMQSNASDVTTQFLAELRVYTTLARHRNIVAFLGCLEGVGMVLEYIDGRTLLDVVRARPVLTRDQKIDFHNQILDGLSHLHSYGLSHGDLSLLNIYVTNSSDTVKLIDFGRSVAADSFYDPPTAEPADPFAFLARSRSGNPHTLLPKKALSHQHYQRKVEQIHLGTRPFTAPEILRGECQDARLADAYSFGVILVCLEVNALVDCNPAVQRKDEYPTEWLPACEIFQDRIEAYLRKCDTRKRLAKEDMVVVKSWWDDDE